MKLLYAEDEPALSEAVVYYLTYHKYIVDAVYDGADAYDYAMTGTYYGIILDIMMPKRDGLEVLSRAPPERMQNAGTAADRKNTGGGPHSGSGYRCGRLSSKAL